MRVGPYSAWEQMADKRTKKPTTIFSPGVGASKPAGKAVAKPAPTARGRSRSGSAASPAAAKAPTVASKAAKQPAAPKHIAKVTIPDDIEPSDEDEDEDDDEDEDEDVAEDPIPILSKPKAKGPVNKELKLQLMIAKLHDDVERQHRLQLKATQDAAAKASASKQSSFAQPDSKAAEGADRRDVDTLGSALEKMESALPPEASKNSRAFPISALRLFAAASLEGAESMTIRALEFADELQGVIVNMENAIFTAADKNRKVVAEEAVEILHNLTPFLANYKDEMVEQFARFTILGRQGQVARKLAQGSNDASFLVQPYSVPEDVSKNSRGVYNIASHTSLPSGGDGWEKSGAGDDVAHKLIISTRESKPAAAKSSATGRERSSAKSSVVRCYNCGEAGHYALNCQYPRPAEERAYSPTPPPRHRSRHSHGSSSRRDSRSYSRSRSRSASPERRRAPRSSSSKRLSSAKRAARK